MQRKRKPNWEKIRLAYEAGEGSYRELAARFNVSFGTLQDVAKRESWVKGYDKTHDKIKEQTRVKLAEEKATIKAKGIAADLQVLDSAIATLALSATTVEPKSQEGAYNAIANLIKIKNQIAPPSAEDLADIAIANGIKPEEFILALAQKWQQQPKD